MHRKTKGKTSGFLLLSLLIITGVFSTPLTSSAFTYDDYLTVTEQAGKNAADTIIHTVGTAQDAYLTSINTLTSSYKSIITKGGELLVQPSDFLASIGSFFSNLFSSPPPPPSTTTPPKTTPIKPKTSTVPKTVPVVTPSPTPKPVVTFTPPTTTPKPTPPPVQTITTRLLSGITASDLNSKIEQLRNELLSRIGQVAGQTQSNYDNNFHAIALTQKIDQLENTVLTTPSITGGSITNASISGGTISGTTISGTTLTVSSGTFSGNLTVSGTATSTFAGDSNFDAGTLYIDSLNNRVGVGTSSPSDTFSVNGPVFLANTTPGATTNRLYSDTSGNLNWNGSVIGGASTGNWTLSGSDVYRATGNVGIGTTSPYAALSVAGQVVGSYFTATSTTATSTFTAGVNVGSGNGYFINGTQAVAGTQSVFASFGFSNTTSISGTNAIAFGVNNTVVGTNSVGFGYTNTASSTNAAAAFGRHNTATALNSHAFGSYNTASGNSSVAFGYTNTASTTGALAFGRNSKATGVNDSAFGYLDTASGGTSSAFGYLNLASGSLSSAFGASTTASALLSSSFGYNNIASAQGASVFGSNITNNIASSTMIGPSDAAKLTILGATGSEGYVGIGTTSPYSMLSVAGQVVGQNFVATSTTATSTFAGAIGIGTTNPLTILGIGGGGQTMRQTGYNGIYANPNSTAAQMTIENSTGIEGGFFTHQASGSMYFGTWSNHPLLFNTNNTEWARLTTTGNFGIGTTSPYSMLSVAGQVVGQNFVATSTTATSTFGGALGIGTTSPNANFALQGTTGQTQNLFNIASSTGASLVSVNPNGRLILARGTTNADVNPSLTINGTWMTGNGLLDPAFPVTAINGTMTVAPTSNDGDYYGNKFLTTYSGSISESGGIIGTVNMAKKLTAASTINDVIGAYNLAQQGSSGLVTNIYGSKNIAQGGAVDSTVTNGYGVYAGLTGSTVSSIANGYGVYVAAAINVGNPYAIYTAGTENSYFGGNVGIGTTSPYSMLSVAGQVVAQNFVATSTTLNSFAGAAGSVTAPTFSFSGDSDTGMYNVTANGLGFGLGGTIYGQMLSTELRYNGPFKANYGSSATNPAFSFTTDGNTGIYNSGADILDVATNGYNLLSVQGNAGNSKIVFSATSTTNQVTTIFSQGGSSRWGQYIPTGSTDMRFYNYTGGADVLTLASSNNNVGIGTTSPYAKLSVVGETVSSNFTATSTTATSTFASGIKITSPAGGYKADPQISFGNGGTGFYEDADGSISVSLNGVQNYLLNSSGISVNTVGGARMGNNTPSTTTPAFTFTADATSGIGRGYAGAMSFISLGSPKMVMEASGNFGIGTTTPYAKLSVEGSSVLGNSATAGYFTATSTTATSLFSGNVTISKLFGVGGSNNSTAQDQMQIRANSNGFSGMQFDYTNTSLGYGNFDFYNTTSAAYEWSFGALPANYDAGSGAVGAGEFFISNDTTGRPILLANSSTGNLGINMANAYAKPYAKLSVQGGGTGNGQTFELFDSASTTLVKILDNGTGYFKGNLGIGTTSPWRTLSVAGSMAIDSPTLSTTGDYLCWNSTTHEVEAGTSCTLSSERFKNNIIPLTDGSLAEVLALKPVSFNFKQGYGDNGSTTQLGFIAEQAVTVDPRLVPLDKDGMPSGFFYQNYTAVLTKAIQELNLKVEDLASTTALTADTSGTKTFVGKFFDRMAVWLGDAANGISDLLANRIHTKTLCVGDTGSGETCITKAQLDALLSGNNTNTAPASTSVIETTPSRSTTTGTSSTIVLEIQGNNPAEIKVGDTYGDLGALITSPESAKNLGIKASLDGGIAMDIGQISIDTSVRGTHTVVYTVIDGTGATTTASRIINVTSPTLMNDMSTTTPFTVTSTTTPLDTTPTATTTSQ